VSGGGAATIVVGLVIVYGGAAELVGHLRSRLRRQRTTAIVVGLVDVGRGLSAANTANRSAVLRFTTRDGRQVEATSSMWSAPGPRVGSRLRVTYDPADPAGTAERAGVQRLKVLLAPLLIAGGAGLAAYGTSAL
jgi:hypothetical protein